MGEQLKDETLDGLAEGKDDQRMTQSRARAKAHRNTDGGRSQDGARSPD